MLIDEKLVSKTTDTLITPDEKIEFLVRDEDTLAICDRCDFIQIGSRIKFVWETSYAQISSVEISYRSKDAPRGYCCRGDTQWSKGTDTNHILRISFLYITFKNLKDSHI